MARAAVVDPAGDGPKFVFQRVPEPQTAKNRVHFDVRLSRRAGSAGLAAEVSRLEDLGAERLDKKDELGTHWVVMRDVEDNAFCVS